MPLTRRVALVTAPDGGLAGGYDGAPRGLCADKTAPASASRVDSRDRGNAAPGRGTRHGGVVVGAAQPLRAQTLLLSPFPSPEVVDISH